MKRFLFGLMLLSVIFVVGCDNMLDTSSTVIVRVVNESGVSLRSITLIGSDGSKYELQEDGSFDINGAGRRWSCSCSTNCSYYLCWVDGNTTSWALLGGTCSGEPNGRQSFTFNAGDKKTIIIKPNNKWEIKNGV